MNETRLCEHCGAPVEQAGTGRPRRYCSATCKRAAHAVRHAPEPVETTPEGDDVLDLDALSNTELSALAKQLGVSLDGDREDVIARILDVVEFANETDETPNETKPATQSATLALLDAVHSRPPRKPRKARPDRPRAW